MWAGTPCGARRPPHACVRRQVSRLFHLMVYFFLFTVVALSWSTYSPSWHVSVALTVLLGLVGLWNRNFDLGTRFKLRRVLFQSEGRTLNDEERLDWLRLIRSTNVGPGTFFRLIINSSTICPTSCKIVSPCHKLPLDWCLL